MPTTVRVSKLEIGGSSQLQVSSYRVEFDLQDSQGPMGYVFGPQAAEPRSYSSGSITVEFPVEQTTEAEVFAKAREMLHDLLTRLAEQVKAPA